MGDDATTASSTTAAAAPVPERKSSSSIFLQITEHQDGSITRPTVPNLPPTDPDSNPSSPVFSKDLPLNPSLNTALRLYLPNTTRADHGKGKLPLVVYYHGGGFVLFSPAFILYHQFCHQMAASLPALVVSLDYRLAPEHRLPAAYDDAVEALLWARASSDPWIVGHADLSRCFVIGSSSGGNMAYHAGLRAADMELNPLKIRGLVLIQPYFGGEVRTESEVESEEDEILPLRANEMMWRMALPVGATRDHEFCSPAANGRCLPVKTMVMGCKGDPLFDRQKMFVKMLRGAGARDGTGEMLVDRLEEEEKGYHAIELFEPARADAVLAQIREFVHQDAAA